VTIVVTITYVTLILRADNDGEGGIMALITLIRRRGAPGGGVPQWCLLRWGYSGRHCSSETA
jgi:K+ transporter